MVRFSGTTTRRLLLASIVLLAAGCTESEILVGSGDELPPQILIISRDVAADPRGDSEEAAERFPHSDAIDPMRLLWVQTYESEYGGSTYRSSLASFWAALDDAGTSASFGHVRLGGQTLARLDADCDEAPATSELCWIIRMNDVPLNVFAAEAPPAKFWDRPMFEAGGDPHLSDIRTATNLVRSNRMANVEPGTRVDPERPWDRARARGRRAGGVHPRAGE